MCGQCKVNERIKAVWKGKKRSREEDSMSTPGSSGAGDTSAVVFTASGHNSVVVASSVADSSGQDLSGFSTVSTPVPSTAYCFREEEAGA